MKVEEFVNVIGADFYAGVPDSQLKALCNYLINTYGVDGEHHIIAANEGNCVGVAAGYHMATGKVPVIYMQNSGEGNVINPVASLLNDKVYAIPAIFVIGWRGEPGVHDEPQHIFQGEITTKLLDVMDIKYSILDENTSVDDLKKTMEGFQKELDKGKNVAFVVRKNALTYEPKVIYENDNELLREEILKHVVEYSGTDPIVSTTGKASRELFEIREANGQSHEYDFLTVGSMGHCSSIALGIAMHKPNKTIWCIDGDGAVLMHMGSMAVIGHHHPNNLIHIVINNAAHETVGGQPTALQNTSIANIAKECGYDFTCTVSTFNELNEALAKAKESKQLSLIEVKSAIGAREDLGRPTTTSLENKENFMKSLEKE